MSIVAFIPARGRSKSIPQKNIRSFCGEPLIFWSLKELQASNVDEIIVATDSKEIKEVVSSFNFSKVKVFDRDPKNAQDASSTESVILEYINVANLNESDTFILVQATSPFTQSNDFNQGLELIKKYDSILSCAVSKRFSWKEEGVPINYDLNNRPRRQDNQGDLIENGAFYITTKEQLLNSKLRYGGKIGIIEMPLYRSFQIDTFDDLKLIESLIKNG